MITRMEQKKEADGWSLLIEADGCEPYYEKGISSLEVLLELLPRILERYEDNTKPGGDYYATI